MGKTEMRKFEVNSLLNIREYLDGDELDIISLFEKVYGRPSGRTESYQHWCWEFLQNPVRPLSIMLAWYGEKLVGHYAVNPARAWFKGKELLVALSLDTMTDSDYSNKGIFSTTAKCTYDKLVASGVSFVFGFPNERSINGFIKHLAWHIISPIAIYILPLDAGPFLKRKTKCDYMGIAASMICKSAFRIFEKHVKGKYGNNKIEIHRENNFGSWANELWLRCRNQHALWIVRDLEYLSWRYDMHPEADYNIFTAWLNGEIVGYIVTISQERNEGRVSFILDILADVNVHGAIEVLLLKVINFSIKNNDAIISAILMPSSVYLSAFHNFFFIRLPQGLFPQKIHFGGRQLNNDIEPKTFKDPTSWHISWGDTDLL
jgi:hypothetical protein